MHGRVGIVTIFVISLAGLLAINLIAGQVLRNANLDMTEQKLYTLSDGSRSMLEKLDDRLKIKFYYSKKSFNSIPIIAQHAALIVGLLDQYQAHSDGMISYEILEPEPDGEIEEWAIKDGIQALPAQGAGGGLLYLGLAITSEVGVSDAIGFLDPQREDRLEYDISQMISSMANPEKQVIGVMSSLDVMGSTPMNPMMMNQRKPPQPWVFISELQKLFDVRSVDLTTTDIDKDIDLMLVIHPKDIQEDTEYAIDQFILGGGRALIMVDPLCVAEIFGSPMGAQNQMQATYDSTMTKLFKAWGLEMSKDKVLGDYSLATQMAMQNRSVRHPAFLTIRESQCNQNEIISSELEHLTVGQGGILEVREDAPYEITRLFESTEKAGELNGFMLKLGIGEDQLKKDFKPLHESFPLAVRVSGTFETAFPGGPPGDEPENTPNSGEEGPPQDTGHLAAADEPGAVVVFADVDFAYDQFVVQRQPLFNLYLQINDNLNLLNNAVEHLLGSSDLIGLRTRGKSQRPFSRVDELEIEAQERYKGEEGELVAKLEEAQRKLNELQRGRDEDERTILSAAQVGAIKNFRREQAATKKRLREVRHDLRKGIEALGSRLKFVNIALIPLLILTAGFLPGYCRASKLKKA